MKRPSLAILVFIGLALICVVSGVIVRHWKKVHDARLAPFRAAVLADFEKQWGRARWSSDEWVLGPLRAGMTVDEIRTALRLSEAQAVLGTSERGSVRTPAIIQHLTYGAPDPAIPESAHLIYESRVFMLDQDHRLTAAHWFYHDKLRRWSITLEIDYTTRTVTRRIHDLDAAPWSAPRPMPE